MSDLEIPSRELHARTGHYVRKAAAEGRILVTHRGQPMAELRLCRVTPPPNRKGGGPRRTPRRFALVLWMMQSRFDTTEISSCTRLIRAPLQSGCCRRP
ncbi:MAG: type II toxin-antitoxin system prevent-host-death family antitoxin [Opitutales bacterium]|nr:type II toxin-antitoxin system prevent-host-death family antitoxin [Opitutales bacterium]